MIVRIFFPTLRVLRSITRMPHYIPPMCHLCSKPNNDSDDKDFQLPPRFIQRPNETLEEKRSRLLYQSRKRGTLESGLILSTFASTYLDDFNPSELSDYDTLINEPTNEWDIYYWATGTRVVPEEYRTGVMELLVRHAQNDSRDARFKQPDLVPKDVT